MRRWVPTLSLTGIAVVVFSMAGAGAAYAPTAVYPAVQAGRVVRGSPRVRARHTLNGALVFEVPSDVQIDSVRFDVGPGLPRTLRWAL